MDIGRFLFITINSKPITSTFRELKESNPGLASVWKNYCSYVYKDDGNLSEDTYEVCWHDKATHVPEFCRIDLICLSYVSGGKMIVKEIRGEEHDILTQLNTILGKVQSNDWILCGWNIKNYDLPLLNKRFFISRLKPHSILPTSETKPWEMKQIFDLKEFWNGVASRGVNTIDALYYSICDDKNVDIMEGNDPEINTINRIKKMFSIIKELSIITE